MMNLHLGVQVLFGVFAGYWLASLCESFFHKHIGHAGRRIRSFCERFPRATDSVLRACYGHHVVHHAKTFRKNFVTQFQSPEEQQELDESLSSAIARDMQKTRYGTTIQGLDIVRFMLPSVPVFLAFYLLAGAWASFGALLPFCVYPMMSKFIHPWIHRPHEVALREAPWAVAMLLRTRYFRAMCRNHFMHHKYVTCDYNFMLGGDYVLGVHRAPNEEDLREMARIGLPTT